VTRRWWVTRRCCADWRRPWLSLERGMEVGAGGNSCTVRCMRVAHTQRTGSAQNDGLHTEAQACIHHHAHARRYRHAPHTTGRRSQTTHHTPQATGHRHKTPNHIPAKCLTLRTGLRAPRAMPTETWNGVLPCALRMVASAEATLVRYSARSA